jgi:hypothetical protein
VALVSRAQLMKVHNLDEASAKAEERAVGLPVTCHEVGPASPRAAAAPRRRQVPAALDSVNP